MGVPQNYQFYMMGFSLVNQPFWGTPISANLHIIQQTYLRGVLWMTCNSERNDTSINYAVVGVMDLECLREGKANNERIIYIYI